MCFLLMLKIVFAFNWDVLQYESEDFDSTEGCRFFFFGAVTLIEVNVINLSPKSNSFFFSEFDACNSPVYV